MAERMEDKEGIMEECRANDALLFKAVGTDIVSVPLWWIGEEFR